MFVSDKQSSSQLWKLRKWVILRSRRWRRGGRRLPQPSGSWQAHSFFPVMLSLGEALQPWAPASPFPLKCHSPLPPQDTCVLCLQPSAVLGSDHSLLPMDFLLGGEKTLQKASPCKRDASLRTSHRRCVGWVHGTENRAGPVPNPVNQQRKKGTERGIRDVWRLLG